MLPAGSATMQVELAGLDIIMIENADAARGLSTSVHSGLEVLAASGADAALFMTCDQPLLTSDVLRQIVAAYAARRPLAVACEYGGTVGVPALFDRLLFGELRALEGDQGAKRVLQRHLAETVRVPFQGGELDVDTPEDALKLGAR